jgi:hypothetical protein
MAATTKAPPSEMAILRRVVERGQTALTAQTARALLRLNFPAGDRTRMNRLAARNRAGRLTSAENEELENYIRVGQTLGILKSKARRSLRSNGKKGK